MISYTYISPSPLNLEALDIEIETKGVDHFERIVPFEGKILCFFSEELTEQEKIDLQDVFDAHEGTPSRSTVGLKSKRSLILDKMVDMAHRHPVLKVDDLINSPKRTGSYVISDYLISIDNWFNGWVRDGNHEVLLAKIEADAQAGQPFEGFLNTVVNVHGHKTYQYLQSHIPTTPYI